MRINNFQSEVRRNLFRNDPNYIKQEKLQLELFDHGLFISHPRTGCNWLKMCMELYFERPSFPISFVHHDNRRLFFHDHDLKLNVIHDKVIYMYRKNISAVVYSNMKYYSFRHNKHHNKFIRFCKRIAVHYTKWLVSEKFTENKTIVCYEDFKKNPKLEFLKICNHISEDFNEEKFKDIYNMVDKKKVYEVLNPIKKLAFKNFSEKDYSNGRKIFVKSHSKEIEKIVLKNADKKIITEFGCVFK